MIKRLVWMGVGAVLGASGTVWGLVRVRQAASRLTPGGLTAEITGAVRQLGADLRAAADEGRAGMREAESRLRAELGEGRPGPRR